MCTLIWWIRRISGRLQGKENSVSRDNYSYKRYQKELARKKKAEEKKQRKLERKSAEEAPESGQTPPVLGAEQANI